MFPITNLRKVVSGRTAATRRRVFLMASAVALVVLAMAATGVLASDKPADAGATSLCVQHFDQVAQEKAAWGSLRWLMNAKLDPKAGITLGVVEIKPGQSNPMHVHGNCEEVIYVLSGSCDNWVGKQRVILNAGDVLRIPAGVPHMAKALGTELTRSIVVYNSGTREFTVVKPKAAK